MTLATREAITEGLLGGHADMLGVAGMLLVWGRTMAVTIDTDLVGNPGNASDDVI